MKNRLIKAGSQVTPSIRVTLVTGLFIAYFGAFLTPLTINAQTTGTTEETLKNAVSGPINELIKPLESLKNQLNTKTSAFNEKQGNNVKNLIEKSGLSYDSVSSFINSVGSWFKGFTDSFNSPAFITWAVDFVKRIFLMIIELVSKVVSYL